MKHAYIHGSVGLYICRYSGAATSGGGALIDTRIRKSMITRERASLRENSVKPR